MPSWERVRKSSAPEDGQRRSPEQEELTREFQLLSWLLLKRLQSHEVSSERTDGFDHKTCPCS